MIPIRPYRGFWYACGLVLTAPRRTAEFREFVQRRRKARRDSILLDAAVAIRAGRLAAAETLLDRHVRKFAGDSEYLNLLGAIYEVQGSPNLAARAYAAANQLDPDYEPARRNIRRLIASQKDGVLDRRVALGDVQLRMQRTT